MLPAIGAEPNFSSKTALQFQAREIFLSAKLLIDLAYVDAMTFPKHLKCFRFIYLVHCLNIMQF